MTPVHVYHLSSVCNFGLSPGRYHISLHCRTLLKTSRRFSMHLLNRFDMDTPSYASCKGNSYDPPIHQLYNNCRILCLAVTIVLTIIAHFDHYDVLSNFTAKDFGQFALPQSITITFFPSDLPARYSCLIFSASSSFHSLT